MMIAGFVERIKGDIQFRIKLFLCLSIIFNFAYSIFLFVVSRIDVSRWFFVMSIYYALLSVTRLFIYFGINPQKSDIYKAKTMRNSGWFLLLINLVVSTMMFILVLGNRQVKYHEITVISLATYTFTTLTVAIINSIRYYKKEGQIYFCVKVISLVSASVSLVTLTNTMLSTFGQDNDLLKSIILPILCVAVSIFIILTAILMIVKANSRLRVLKNEK